MEYYNTGKRMYAFGEYIEAMYAFGKSICILAMNNSEQYDSSECMKKMSKYVSEIVKIIGLDSYECKSKDDPKSALLKMFGVEKNMDKNKIVKQLASAPVFDDDLKFKEMVCVMKLL